MSGCLLTVILPVFNAERFLSEAIESVLGQTVRDWELLVVDDGSTDGSVGVAAGFQRRDPRIQMLTDGRNNGVAHARNLGLDHAKGEFVAFIDSDDIWYPEKSARQIEAMERWKADISYTGYLRKREGEPNGFPVSVPGKVSYHTMLRRNAILCSTGMVRRATCGAVRMPRLRRRQDHGYWLELLRDGSLTATGVDEVLVQYRLHQDSLSSNKVVAAAYTWKLLREVERFGLVRAAWLFAGYAFQALSWRHHLRKTGGT